MGRTNEGAAVRRIRARTRGGGGKGAEHLADVEGRRLANPAGASAAITGAMRAERPPSSPAQQACEPPRCVLPPFTPTPLASLRSSSQHAPLLAPRRDRRHHFSLPPLSQSHGQQTATVRREFSHLSNRSPLHSTRCVQAFLRAPPLPALSEIAYRNMASVESAIMRGQTVDCTASWPTMNAASPAQPTSARRACGITFVLRRRHAEGRDMAQI